MKVKSKDEIVTKLIDNIKLRHSSINVPHIETYHDGWVKALEWVLSIDNEEVFTKGENTLVVKEKSS